jgi:hypothetical protein
MERTSQIACQIVPLRHFFPLKVVPLIEVLLYAGCTICGTYMIHQTNFIMEILRRFPSWEAPDLLNFFPGFTQVPRPKMVKPISSTNQSDLLLRAYL